VYYLISHEFTCYVTSSLSEGPVVLMVWDEACENKWDLVQLHLHHIPPGIHHWSSVNLTLTILSPSYSKFKTFYLILRSTKATTFHAFNQWWTYLAKISYQLYGETSQTKKTSYLKILQGVYHAKNALNFSRSIFKLFWEMKNPNKSNLLAKIHTYSK